MPFNRHELEVYVASALGFTESTRLFMDEQFVPAIEQCGFRTFNPWSDDSTLTALVREAQSAIDLNERRLRWRKVTLHAGKRNVESIRRCDGLVAVLDGVDVDSGTAAEIGYASAFGKWIIGYRGDLRHAGEDPAGELNLQVEYFVTTNGSTIVHSIPEMRDELERKWSST